MSQKNKFQLEYTFNSSPKVLFNRLSTAGGLAEWFADDVNLRNETFSFVWDGFEQQATLVSKKDQKHVRFHWVEDEDEKTYFEFKVDIDELTGDVALIITDFAEDDEKDDAVGLWDSQITELRRILGI